MKILVVNLFDISRLPPVRNLIEVLINQGHIVTLVTYNEKCSFIKHKNLSYIQINKGDYNNIFTNALHFFVRKKVIRRIVREQMLHHDIIWTTTDMTVRELGKMLFNYRHVMQLMELIEDMPAFPYQHFFKAGLKKYAKVAMSVVVPEINRAHIQKIWWELDRLPYVLPNKPYSVELYDAPQDVSEKLEQVRSEKRKIILYQGIFRDERNLEKFAQAVSDINSEYCLYIMGEDNEIRKDLCNKFPDTVYVPFIPPPYHLLITEYAYIGLMPYIAHKNKKSHISELNALYCAPNKIYEYSAFGVPMIGTNVPGLMYPFGLYNIGVCSELCREDIVKAVKMIDNNYDQMKNNCRKFYEETELDSIVKGILNNN